ncbi:hypothetical protein Vretimale_6500 [Volvox reticuliferus]|uniref:DUF7491 domain-containing protein n=1 Tax=Volvox reticuliferus TaxID=1737510 RepID=A0A8J4G7R0_9CHLO|nr:hypothetical protein Vretimale_6500 [Volvox reticuliferus]
MTLLRPSSRRRQGGVLSASADIAEQLERVALDISKLKERLQVAESEIQAIRADQEATRAEHQAIRAEHQAIRAEHQAIRAEHQAIRADSQAIRAGIQAIRPGIQAIRAVENRAVVRADELTVLENSTHAFAKVLRRSLVEDTYKFLEAKAGLHQIAADGTAQRWHVFKKRIVAEKGNQWFEDHVPLACIVILPMGFKSPVPEGCDAAHELRRLNPDVFRTSYMAGLDEEQQCWWEELYNFVSQASI